MLVRPTIEDPGAAADEEVGDEEEADDERYEEYVEHASTVPPAHSDGGSPYGICTRIPGLSTEA
jgi:hypothetical protein